MALKDKLNRFCFNRVPKGSGPLLVFILNVLESFVFYGAFGGLLRLVLNNSDPNLQFFLNFALTYSVGRLLYPIGGFLADVYFGRFRMIRITLLLFWVAYAIMALALSLYGLFPDLLVRVILPIIACALLLVASGGFETTIIPFGADQLSQGASSEEISSYFYWYYFGRQGGVLLFVLLTLGLYLNVNNSAHLEGFDFQIIGTVEAFMYVVAMTIALCVQMCFQDRFFKDTTRSNPLKLAVGVICYAVTAKRHAPRYRRAFRYGEAKKPRIELAKIEYDGIYSSEEVEDTKTFCQILLFLFSLGGFFVSYSGAHVMISLQMNNYSNSSTNPVLHHLAPNLLDFCNIVTILICLPIMNHLVVPYLQNAVSMKHHIGLGVFLNLGTLIASICLELFQPRNRLPWLLLPAVLLSIGEMLVFATALQFIYAQSPENMKGLLIGLFYFIFGLFSGGGALIFHWYPPNENCFEGTNCILWYYVILAIIGVLGVVAYLTIACLYTYRQRPAGYQEETEAICRLHGGEYSSTYSDYGVHSINFSA